MKPDQIRRYYEVRLNQHLTKQRSKVKCPFHPDDKPSLSVHQDKGWWKCFAGCGQGDVVEFEMKFSSCEAETAKANISEVCGSKMLFSGSNEPERVYQYRNARKQLVFEKLRYPGKRFSIRVVQEDGSWKSGMNEETPRILYRLPELITCNYAFICEGEKDADNIIALDLSNDRKKWFVSATTNFDGGGHWNDEYAPYFTGKQCVVFEDNDDTGRKHAKRVTESIYKFAASVKIVSFPELPEHGDVSDYLKDHAVKDLLDKIQKSPDWSPVVDGTPQLFVPVTRFAAAVDEEISWMVEGVIERGANGVIAADPKVGKSWLATDLAISLALGVDCLGFRISRPVKTALVSREDNPALTAWRIRHLSASKVPPEPGLFEKNFHINSRRESKQLMLDNADQVRDLLQDLKLLKPEFLLFDVFNVLHEKNENDNQDMRRVLKVLTEIQSEIGCGIGIIHHFNKAQVEKDGVPLSITQRLRGSSAIAGWCEWAIGLALEENKRVRRMDFEVKAAMSPDPVYWEIQSRGETAQLVVVDQEKK